MVCEREKSREGGPLWIDVGRLTCDFSREAVIRKPGEKQLKAHNYVVEVTQEEARMFPAKLVDPSPIRERGGWKSSERLLYNVDTSATAKGFYSPAWQIETRGH